MKKVFLAIWLLGVSGNLLGQEEKKRFGAKGGVNFSDFSSTDYRTSFHIGALVEIPIFKKIHLQPELVYSSQGGENVFQDIETISKVDYINIPVMFKLFLSKRFNIQAGPQLGMLLCANDQITARIDGVDQRFEGSIRSLLTDFDFGLNFGLGYQSEVGVFIDGRFNWGLTDVTKIDSDISEVNNVVFQFSLGYMFL